MILFKKLDDVLFFDIGAQIGQYTMFVAKLGRKVISVEPFIENIYRLHKAIRTESLQDNVILIQNAMSNKRNEIKALNPSSNNIGGQSLLPQMFMKYERNETNKYLVETILIDDLVPFVPKKSDGSEYTKAIMKVDIEGFEAFAFQNASKLFDRLDFRMVVMEWAVVNERFQSNKPLITDFINFFVNRGFKVMGVDGRYQDIQASTNLQGDIIWTKL